MLPIKAIPTRYAGVNFRSRLEARWAAFFDLCDWQWSYEPIDFDGWIPDFQLTTPWCPVFAEVKPVIPEFLELYDGVRLDANDQQFAKAFDYWRKVQVLLLGTSPEKYGIGSLLDPPHEANGEPVAYHWADVRNFLDMPELQPIWREAGNRVQWAKQSQISD